MKTENWVKIIGYESLYEISNFGNVRRIKRYGKNVSNMLLPYLSEKGYLKVGLCGVGKKKICKVHRLVATHFVENKNNLSEINHKNCIKTDNNAENLEWCTRKQNMVHASANNLIKKRVGKDNQASKPVIQLSISGEFIKKWDCLSDAKKGIGVSNAHIGCVCKGKRKKAGGFKWEYAEPDKLYFVIKHGEIV
jgi:hypothetical protein